MGLYSEIYCNIYCTFVCVYISEKLFVMSGTIPDVFLCHLFWPYYILELHLWWNLFPSKLLLLALLQNYNYKKVVFVRKLIFIYGIKHKTYCIKVSQYFLNFACSFETLFNKISIFSPLALSFLIMPGGLL